MAMVLCGFTMASRFAPPASDPPWITPREVYDPTYNSIQSVDQVVELVKQRKGHASIGDQVHELEEILRRRFYHGYTRYGLHENWMAWLSAKLINPDVNALVDPDEIIRHNAGACSQQGLVVQAALHKMGIAYGSVGVPEHFFTAAWINGRWFMVDPWGPVERDRSRLHLLEDIMTVDGRNHLYKTSAERQRWDKLRFSPPQLTHVNEFPAPRALAFVKVTRVLSEWLWLPVVLLALALAPDGLLRRRVFSGQLARAS